ncbi:pantoate--beta-alanine ligase [Flavihumibacter sp. R14]|nr:pantoate--beta-alanine ligase [Flavihumibacter soli]
MKIFTTRATLSGYLTEQKSLRKIIGLVPTMGALHAGHLSLIEQAHKESDVVVCSIFVNPTQFNDPGDLAKYPRPIESDIKKLENSECDVLFMPSVSEMYSEGEEWNISLNGLDSILEGKIRPGHYQGVTQIVKKLFDTVMPDKAFFGQKDYQQVQVIAELVRQYQIPVQLITCPIVREADGLAMSSRNVHLSAAEHQQALVLSRALNLAQQLFPVKTIPEVKDEISRFVKQTDGVELEYFEICDGKTLQPVTDKDDEPLVALIAAKVGGIRLIDNVILE